LASETSTDKSGSLATSGTRVQWSAALELSLHPDWRPVAVGDAVAIVASEDAAVTLQHPAAAAVVTALVESQTIDAILSIDGASLLLEQLGAAGALVRQRPPDAVAAAAYWDALPAAVRAVRWIRLTSAAEEPLARLLAANGVEISDAAGVTLVTTDDYLHPDLPQVAADATQPWLLARPVGHALLLGPLFVPDAGPCWRCLAH
jgi:hypothetical protein